MSFNDERVIYMKKRTKQKKKQSLKRMELFLTQAAQTQYLRLPR